MMDFVGWDDDIPNNWKNKIHVPNHQPENNANVLLSFWSTEILGVL